MAQHNEVGQWGERLACEKLLLEGATIREHNWRCGHYEIDIIASKDDTLIFGEVKTRTDMEDDPLDAIDKRKISFMIRSARAYMQQVGFPADVRFDVFAINGTPSDYKIEHIPDAFHIPLKTY